MKRIFSLLLILSLTIAIIGCDKDSDEIIGIRGEIKEIYTDEESGIALNFLVEGELEDDTTYDSAYVTLESDTKIYKGDEKATIEDLAEGIIVEIVFEGSVGESYPVQGTAEKIIILDN